jgi:hypothetical protein
MPDRPPEIAIRRYRRIRGKHPMKPKNTVRMASGSAVALFRLCGNNTTQTQQTNTKPHPNRGMLCSRTRFAFHDPFFGTASARA